MPTYAAFRRRAAATLAAIGIAGAMTALIPATAEAAPSYFQMPFQCNQTWQGNTYSGHTPSELSIDWTHGSTTAGQPVLASAGGTVVISKSLGDTSYGEYIVIDHGGGWKTLYGHLSARLVAAGETVTAGQQIGMVGSTGNSTGPHLHYEQKYNDAVQQSTFNGSAFAAGTSATSQNCAPVRRTSDITGDGRAEIVTQEPDGGIAMGVGDGNGFSNYHRITGNGFADYVNTGRIHFADVTGDGKADIIVQEADGGITMGVGDGNGFSNYHRITGNGFADYLNGGNMHFADITGDGKADIINQEADGGVTLGVGDGNGFSNYHRITGNGFADYLNNGRMHFADITGDGKADIINQEADGGVTLGVGDGNGFSNYHRITTNGFADYLNGGRMHFADITGDGKADIITQEPDGGITMGVGDGNGFSNYHRITTNGFADYLNTPNIQFVG
ncbi:hypothetical protein GCM10023205_84340 [Yinghuangia aomiensis]|uniref:M23ase beta-sheet core domain-containing protein n=1 Tax=Yinghuangia aomiensis TaxID=676205 RepID=A0ABP9IH03_9ACTN